MHAISSYRGNRPTNTHAHKQTHIQDRLKYTAPQLARSVIMKKCSEEMQTLRTGCSKAEPKIFALPQTPFLGAQDSQNLISWRWSLPLPTIQTQFGKD